MKISVINSINKIGEFISDLQEVDTIYLDIETSSLDPFTCIIYSIQIKIKDKYFIFDFTKFDKLEYLISLIEDKLIVAHNAKFDCRVILVNTGINLLKVYCTMIAEVLINLGVGQKLYSLGYVVEKYTDDTVDKSVRETFYNSGKLFSLTQEQIIYSALDVKNLEKIRDSQIELLKDQKKVLEMEMKLLPVVVTMEIEGILLDKESWDAQMETTAKEVKRLRALLTSEIIDSIDFSKCKNLYEACIIVKIPVKLKRDRIAMEKITHVDQCLPYLKREFNIGSYNQLLTALQFRGYKVKSTSMKVLRRLPKSDFITSLIQFKEFAKLLSSFGESVTEKIHPVTGMIHADANQVGTRSGRFSYSNPNLQQIPKDSKYRGCIIPGLNFLFLRADWDQQELRLVGSASGEPRFIDAYKNGIDMHSLTASLVFDIKIDDVTKEQRNLGKTFNFAIIYGSSVYGLSYSLNLPLNVVEKLYDRFFESYPILSYYKTQMENMIAEKRFVYTLYGRKRQFTDKTLFVDSKEYYRTIGAIKREGFNTIIQGTGAEILKLSMIDVYYNNPYGDPRRPLNNKLKLVLVIHDELVAKITPDIQEGAKEFMKEAMLRNEQMFLKDIDAAIDIRIMDKLSK